MGEFGKFVGRYALASIFGALGVISLALGYADQAQKISTDFEPWQLQGLGAAFIIVFIVLVLMKMDKAYRERFGAMVPASPAPAKAALTETTKPAVPAFTPAANDGRTFLAADLTPAKMMAMCKGKTDVHAVAAVAPYLGKWFRFSGKVANVFLIGGKVTITFDVSDGTAVKARTKNSELADVLHVGDKIEVEGKISKITSVHFTLEDARVLGR